MKMWDITTEEFKENIDEYLNLFDKCPEMVLTINTGKTELVLEKMEYAMKVKNKALDMGFQLGLIRTGKSSETPPHEGEEPHAGIICSSFDPETGIVDDIIEVTSEL